MNPARIQRKRTKGWRMPEGAVYVGRPTKWGNPYQVGVSGVSGVTNHKSAVLLFRSYLRSVSGGIKLVPAIRRELRGKDLACWCPPDRECHADILLQIANQ